MTGENIPRDGILLFLPTLPSVVEIGAIHIRKLTMTPKEASPSECSEYVTNLEENQSFFKSVKKTNLEEPQIS